MIRPGLAVEVSEIAQRVRALRQEVEREVHGTATLLDLARALSDAEAALKDAEVLALALTATVRR